MRGLVTVKQLSRLVGLPIEEMDEIAQAEEIIGVVSDIVRLVGDDWADPVLTPRIVRSIVLEVAARYYLNPEGFVMERGDQATFQRSEEYAAGGFLTPLQQKLIRGVATGKPGGFTSVVIRRDVQLVSDSGDSGGSYGETN